MHKAQKKRTMENFAATIRAEAPDTPEAQALIAELDNCLNALYAPENRHGLSVNALLHDPTIVFFVARVNGEAVGCGAVRFVDGDANDATLYAEVKRMYVPPRFRGRGIARALLAELEAHARRKGVPMLRLETGVFQQEAVRLYERAGFMRRGPFGDYTQSDVNLWYEKPLFPEPA